MMITAEQLRFLPQLLLPWFAENKRDLPWRRDREPYHVWLSEIMLQQTRVEAVKGYYERFLSACPDIRSLAEASTDQLNKLWEGLGYYSRVRNLQAAAQTVMSEYQGSFPSQYDAIVKLKGIGAYTAGAIASICFDQPTPAVDGNVLRVILRLTADSSPAGEERTKTMIRDALTDVYPAGHCGEFTQSLMELGATVCVPNGTPDCNRCPLQAFCGAKDGAWRELPVREKKKPRRIEEKTVFILDCDGEIAVRKRSDHGLLAGLWELPNAEGFLSAEEALRQAEAWGVHPNDLIKTVERTHIFTHVQWQMNGIYLTCRSKAEGFVWADRSQRTEKIALPTAFRMFLEDDTSNITGG